MNKDNNSLRSSKRPPKTINVRYGWTDAQIEEQEAANAKSRQRREAEKLAVLARRKTTSPITKIMSTSSKTDDENVGGAGAATGAVKKAPKQSLITQDQNVTSEPLVEGDFKKLAFSSVSSEGAVGDQNGRPNAKQIAGNEFLADKTNLEELIKELEDHLELGSTPEAVNGHEALIISLWAPVHARTLTYIGHLSEAEANEIKNERVALKRTFEVLRKSAKRYSKAWAKRALDVTYEMSAPPPLSSDKDWKPKPMSQCTQSEREAIVARSVSRCTISVREMKLSTDTLCRDARTNRRAQELLNLAKNSEEGRARNARVAMEYLNAANPNYDALRRRLQAEELEAKCTIDKAVNALEVVKASVGSIGSGNGRGTSNSNASVLDYDPGSLRNHSGLMSQNVNPPANSTHPRFSLNSLTPFLAPGTAKLDRIRGDRNLSNERKSKENSEVKVAKEKHSRHSPHLEAFRGRQAMFRTTTTRVGITDDCQRSKVR
jgi:hypothetical protein